MKVKPVLFSIALMLAVFAVAAQASAWSLEEAAGPYAGTELEVVFLLRASRTVRRLLVCAVMPARLA